MLIQVAGLMAGVIVVPARLLRHAPVAMAFRIEVARCVLRMVVVLTGNLAGRLVPMSVLVQVTRLVARVVVVRARLLLRHPCSPT